MLVMVWKFDMAPMSQGASQLHWRPMKRAQHAVLVAGQVIGHRDPRITAIVRPPQALVRGVQAGGGVGRHQDRCIPVEARRRVVGAGLRLNQHHLTGAPIHAMESADLGLGVGDVRVARLGGRLVTVGAEHDLPVLVVMPLDRSVRDGPAWVLLSWVPP
jgi:hypothetical protein